MFCGEGVVVDYVVVCCMLFVGSFSSSCGAGASFVLVFSAGFLRCVGQVVCFRSLSTHYKSKCAKNS